MNPSHLANPSFRRRNQEGAMPIPVHCPNPDCAQVHLVKSKYAGMRGRCPACQAWMYIPRIETPGQVALPQASEPTQEVPLDQTPAPAPRKREPIQKTRSRPVPALDESAAIPNEPALVPDQSAPTRKQRTRVVEDEERTNGDAPEEPKHFSWLAVVCLFLAMVGLAGFAAASFLPGPTLQKTGDFATWPNPQGIGEGNILFVCGAAGAVALFGLLALLISLIGRRMGVIALLLTYLATMGSSALLLVSLEWFMREAGPDGTLAKLQKQIKQETDAGASGEATPNLGYQYHTLVAGALVATFFFVLSGLFMHRHVWSTLVGFFVLTFFPTLSIVWGMRTLLGIPAYILPF